MDERARRDLTDAVLGDLRWLRDADLSRGDRDLLRELSGRLRRLLIDGNLQLYRKRVRALRGEMTVLTPPSLDFDSPGTKYAQVGGGNRSGIAVEGMTVWDRALTAEEIKARYDDRVEARRESRRLRLSVWLDEPCVVFEGVAASRREVIKFVANKLGGVHVDPRRDASKFPAYGTLDQARESLQVADLDAVYFELASIGQQLVESPEIAELLRYQQVP